MAREEDRCVASGMEEWKMCVFVCVCVCVCVWGDYVCVCVCVFAESSSLRVISQSPQFDTMRSAQPTRRHTLLF